MSVDAETKNIVNDLINKFVEIIRINIFNDDVREEIRKTYGKGLEEAEVKFNMNFSVNPQKT